MIVEELMTKDVVTVRPETPLKEVARLLRDRGISGVPVVADDHLLGVVSETDIVMKERGRLFTGRRLKRVAEQKRTAATAGEAMTSPVVTIELWRTATGAATLMLDYDVNRLPVLDNQDRLVGILTRADLVRAFARSDAEIAREINEDVVVRSFWLEPATITVTVVDGEVTLEGEVGSEPVADSLVSAVERVAGVVSVDSSLTLRDADRVSA
jgi:CBS domain-containing protein